MRGSQHPPLIRGDFSLQLLTQIEMLRGDISHEELSKRLGDVTERYLARYVAGKVHLLERDFYQLAQALCIRPRVLAEQWAAACGLRVRARLSDKDSRLAGNRVPPSPSPMTIIREKYADRLLRKTPRLTFYFDKGKSPISEARKRFARGYEMLVQFVHDHESQRTIGAMHGIGPTRARRLMRSAAYAWARNQGINLSCDKSVPFKADAKLVRNLYAGLRFFAQQQFAALDAQAHTDKYDGTKDEF